MDKDNFLKITIQYERIREMADRGIFLKEDILKDE